jgi:SAM-dependent methyltransferase
LIRKKLWPLLACTRIPGNAFSFWIRQTLHWSRGTPTLYQESKVDLFAYLKEGRREAEAREADLRAHYQLDPLARLSTAALYRKNLYLLDTLDKATKGLQLPSLGSGVVKALDVGSQDWYYVFALERWLQFHNRLKGRQVHLKGIELDGYELYADFHSRQDYAKAYVDQTGNLEVRYELGDFLKSREAGFDFVFIFYPLVMRYQLLLWGLPLRYFAPQCFLAQAATMTRPGGWLVVFCHTLREHEIFLELGRATKAYQLLREGQVLSNLVDFHGEVNDSRFSIWRKN